MSNYQEALDGLKYIVIDEEADGYNDPRTLVDFNFGTMRELQELVDKDKRLNTPVKPVDQKCGLCQGVVFISEKVDGHWSWFELARCVDCGAKVDWSETDERELMLIGTNWTKE